MTDLYLIAHKVRGEPAFDIAARMPCPECDHGKVEYEGTFEAEDCGQCDSLGYWWIIPTSGHRAYPYWSEGLYEFSFNEGLPDISAMPSDLPDHYIHKAAPQVSLIEALGLHKPKPTASPAPIVRRI